MFAQFKIRCYICNTNKEINQNTYDHEKRLTKK